MTPERIAELRTWSAEEDWGGPAACCISAHLGRGCDCGKERAAELLAEIERLSKVEIGATMLYGVIAKTVMDTEKDEELRARVLAMARSCGITPPGDLA